jgi:hypothetical protein
MNLAAIIEYLNLKLHIDNEKNRNKICDLYNASIKEHEEKKPDF